MKFSIQFHFSLFRFTSCSISCHHLIYITLLLCVQPGVNLYSTNFSSTSHTDTSYRPPYKTYDNYDDSYDNCDNDFNGYTILMIISQI